MTLFFRFLTAAILACLASPTFCFAAALKDVSSEFVLPEGLSVTLWAESPQLFNPTAMDVDARGRIWVVESVNYRGFRNKQADDPESKWHAQGDRVLILEDTNGDGVCDSSKVFVQDSDLVSPVGIAVVGRRVIVSCSPSAIVYTDTNGDDRPDEKEVFLTGFGGFDHDHSLHSFVGGPDGRWYFNVGNAGPHFVTDKSGWTLRSGSSYSGGTPYNTNNVPHLRSDDGRVWVGGLALRINADGSGLKPIGHNFRNAYELTVDSFGNVWQNDNDDTISCRTTWLMEGGNLGFASADGSRAWQADRRPWQDIPTAHWRQEDPGVIPSGDITGPGAPTGICFYEHGSLGAKFDGMLLSCDAGRNVVFGYQPKPDGAGYKLERFIFFTSLREAAEDQNYKWNELSEDRRKWFRPSDVVMGTDGAIYVADWYDPIVGGHQAKDKPAYGRIYRIAKQGSQPGAPRIDLQSLEGQLAALNSPAINVRFQAQERIRQRGAKALAEVRQLLDRPSPFVRARALWLMTGLGELGRETIVKHMRDPNPDLRITAFRAIRQLDHDVLKHAAALTRDPSPAVRREAALSLRDVPLSECQELIVELASRYDGRDRWYLEALGTACDGKEAAVFPVLLEKLGHADPLQWSAAFADIAWRLHPPAAIPALTARAKAGALPLAQRHRAIDALAFIRDPAAAAAMAELALQGSTEIKTNAYWWARNRAGNDWKGFAIVQSFLPPPNPKKTAKEQAQFAAWEKTLLDASQPMPARETALTHLAGNRDGGMLLIRLASEKKLPTRLLESTGEIIHRNPDLGVRALASQYFPRPSRSGDAFPPLVELLKMRGDARRGQESYHSAIANCATCHRFGDAGRDIGPDLTEIRTKFDRAGLFDAILNPSAAITFGYEAWIITTKDDETYTGFILANGDDVILKEISGEHRVIPAKDIAQRQPQTLSIMPDNISLGLTPQELVDVVEFLLQPPRAVAAQR